MPAVTGGPALSPTPLRGSVVVTLKDGRQALELAVGETFVLDLGARMTWTVEVDDRILARVEGAAPAGTQGVYRAVAPGETQLLANGSPACAKATPPCQLPDILFTLRVVVR
jgi:hypothetical protein